MSEEPLIDSRDERLAALIARRDTLIARGVPEQYAHIEALLELEWAADPPFQFDDSAIGHRPADR